MPGQLLRALGVVVAELEDAERAGLEAGEGGKKLFENEIDEELEKEVQLQAVIRAAMYACGFALRLLYVLAPHPQAGKYLEKINNGNTNPMLSVRPDAHVLEEALLVLIERLLTQVARRHARLAQMLTAENEDIMHTHRA